MSAGPELDPDVEEVLQVEDGGRPAPVVPVTVAGPVRVQELPKKAGATFTRPSVGVTAVRLLRTDHRRATARIMSIGGAMRFCFAEANAGEPTRMATWPANTQLLISTSTDVWVAAATGTTDISVMTELWATGND